MFAGALAVRLLVAAQLSGLPLVRTPKLDSAEYLAWARRMASGDFTWPAVSAHAPGYPLFLAALLASGSGSLTFAIVVQAIVGAATAVLIALTARRWFGARAGWIAGAAYAVYGPAVYVDTAILSEGLLLFCLTLALYEMSRSDSPAAGERAVPAGLAGAAVGAAILVRPTAVLFAAAFAVVIAARKRWPQLAIYAAALAVVVLPAVAKSRAASGSWTLQGYGGLNVYIGDSPLQSGRPTFRLGAGWDALNSEAARAGVTDAAAQDRYYVAKTIDEIRAHPAAFVRLLAAKALWTLQAEEVRDSHSYYFFADQSAVLRVLPRWAILFALACVGIPAIARRSSWPDLAAFTLAALASVVLLVVGTRYRMPLVPAMAIAAGAGVDALAAAAAMRRTRELAAAGAIAIAAVVVSHSLHDPRNRNLAEEWAFTGSALITEHDLPGAMDAYRLALRLDPGSSLAWDGFALAQYDAGQTGDARASLGRALAAEPDNGRARFHLGLVDEYERKFDAAAASYRAAVALSPFDAEAALRLATVLGMAGRTSEAREAMQRAVQLNPSNGDAWLDLCLLSLDAQDVATAADALQRAESLGANPQKLAFASQALAKARR